MKYTLKPVAGVRCPSKGRLSMTDLKRIGVVRVVMLSVATILPGMSLKNVCNRHTNDYHGELCRIDIIVRKETIH